MAGIGDAVDSLFGAFGHFEAEKSYKTAGKYAKENVGLEKQSLAIKLAQTRREVFKVIGGQQADVAAAGFGKGGTAGDLLRDSAAQGALAEAGVQVQGAININAAQAEVDAAAAKAKSEHTAGIGGIFGAILGVASIFI